LVRDRGGIGARVRAHELGARSLRPEPELIDGARAKRVTRREQHALSLFSQALAQLANKRRLASTVDADHEHDRRFLRSEYQARVAVAAAQRVFDASAKRVEELLFRANLALLRAPRHVVHEAQRDGNAEV